MKIKCIIFHHPKVEADACLSSLSTELAVFSWTVTMAKDITSDDEFNKHVTANKFVLAIFMDSSTEMDVSKICKVFF